MDEGEAKTLVGLAVVFRRVSIPSAGVGDGDQGLVGQSAQRIEDLAGRHLLVGTDGFGRGQAQPPLNTASLANRRRSSSNSRS